MQIIALFALGGIASALLLSVEYLRFLFQRKTRQPWSRWLGIGWCFFLTGIGLMWYAQFTPLKNYSWQDGWGGGFMSIALCIWWVAVIIYFLTRTPRAPIVMSYEQPQEEDWPPPDKPAV